MPAASISPITRRQRGEGDDAQNYRQEMSAYLSVPLPPPCPRCHLRRPYRWPPIASLAIFAYESARNTQLSTQLVSEPLGRDVDIADCQVIAIIYDSKRHRDVISAP